MRNSRDAVSAWQTLTACQRRQGGPMPIKPELKTLIAGLAVIGTLYCSANSLRAAAPASASSPNGDQLYRHFCAQCHSQSRVLRAPQLKVLQRMEPQDILDALEVGNMRFQ